MPRHYDNKLKLGFLTIAALVLLIGLYVYLNRFEKQRQGQAVVHTHLVLNQLDSLSNHLLDAETAQRGYLLAGQPAYLRSYTLALHPIEYDLAQFQQLTQDNPRQQASLPHLRSQIADRLTELKKAIDVRTEVSLEAAVKVVVSGGGTAKMTAIREQISAMKAEEQRLLHQRITVWVATESTHLIFGGMAILSCLLLGGVYLALSRESLQRHRRFDLERQSGADHRAEAERLAKVVAIQRNLACVRQSLQATMQNITDRTRDIVHADGGTVALLVGGKLVTYAVSGTASPFSSMRIEIAKSLSGRCVRENAVIRCHDTEVDGRIDMAVVRQVGVRSAVAVPLWHNGHVIGAFTVRWALPNGFTEQDVVTLELIAGALSAALSDAVGMDVLQTSEERLDDAQRTAHIGSWELNLATRMTAMSGELARMLGLAPGLRELDYDTFQALFASDDLAPGDEHILLATLDGIGYEMDIRRTFSDGETPRWYHAICKPLYDSQGKIIRLAGTFMDITERKRTADAIESQKVTLLEMNAKLEHSVIRLEELATIDSLTGLKNHGTFQSKLKEEYDRAVRYRSPLSVILLDVDLFKQYNDAHGHQAGDVVLTQVARILQRVARSTDNVARYGGEEFVLILPETGAEEARTLAKRLLYAIASESWEHGDVTASFGIATLSALALTATALVEEADIAMYRSKHGGRNCVTHFLDGPNDDLLDVGLLGPGNAIVRTGLIGAGETLAAASV